MAFQQLARSIALISLVGGSSVAIAQPALATAQPVTSPSLEPTFEPNAADVLTRMKVMKPAPKLTVVEPYRQPNRPLNRLTEPSPLQPVPAPPSLTRLLRTAERPLNAARSQLLLSQNAPASELPESEVEPVPLPAEEAPPVLPSETPPESVPELTPEPPPELTPEPAPEPAPSGRTQVDVTDIQVVGSSVFDEQDFEPVVSPYEGRRLGLSELRQVADDVTQLYLESGYITSRAVLGEQTITDGRVQVRVIEGELEEIQVEGTRRLAGYVRDRVNLANRKPLNQVDLESQLQLLRADPLVERIEASLRAGTGEGQSQLIVRVREADAFSGRAVIDTNSPPSVGTVRTGIEGSYNNLLGIGDRLSASAYRSTAGGSNTYGVTYTLPLNALNGTLQARYLPSSFDLIDPEFAALGVEGSSNTYELTYRQPIVRKPNEEFALSLGFRHRTGETLVSDIVIDSTRTSVVQFGQDYLKRDRLGAWGLRSQFNLGTGLLDATNRDDGEADGQFFSWLGQVQRAQVLNRNNLLLMQGSLQLSADALLGADQFIIGGPSSVRGYSQNARFGDNGFRASIEDRITVVRNDDDSVFAQLAPFVDTAAVWNQGANTSDQNFLLGTGVGLVVNPTEDIQARVDLGIPLIKLDEAGDSDQSAFIYFTMDYRF
ncbi:MAG: ShlB/FhaC/HecB family hemolysin secretion/activation protein [Cyanobacteria bacterium P01_A01_bin.116]